MRFERAEDPRSCVSSADLGTNPAADIYSHTMQRPQTIAIPYQPNAESDSVKIGIGYRPH